AALISLSESGITSQKVSVKSNGVCAIEQKFEYVRGVVVSSSGTIVKLICLGWSGMGPSLSVQSAEGLGRVPRDRRRGPLVFPHHAHDHALNLNLVARDEDRLHGGVGRLEADHAAGIAIELLQRDVRPAQERDHHLAVVRGLPILDDDEVAVANLL